MNVSLPGSDLDARPLRAPREIKDVEAREVWRTLELKGVELLPLME